MSYLFKASSFSSLVCDIDGNSLGRRTSGVPAPASPCPSGDQLIDFLVDLAELLRDIAGTELLLPTAQRELGDHPRMLRRFGVRLSRVGYCHCKWRSSNCLLSTKMTGRNVLNKIGHCLCLHNMFQFQPQGIHSRLPPSIPNCRKKGNGKCYIHPT
jgi:hypothetical protein